MILPYYIRAMIEVSFIDTAETRVPKVRTEYSANCKNPPGVILWPVGIINFTASYLRYYRYTAVSCGIHLAIPYLRYDIVVSCGYYQFYSIVKVHVLCTYYRKFIVYVYAENPPIIILK
jgi:hypothetical protein